VIVRAAAVAVQLDPIVEEPVDVVERVRTFLVSRQLDGAPDLLVRRRGLDAFELALQLLELARNRVPPSRFRLRRLARRSRSLSS